MTARAMDTTAGPTATFGLGESIGAAIGTSKRRSRRRTRSRMATRGDAAKIIRMISMPIKSTLSNGCYVRNRLWLPFLAWYSLMLDRTVAIVRSHYRCGLINNLW